MPGPSAVPTRITAGAAAFHAAHAGVDRRVLQLLAGTQVGTPPQMPIVSGPECEWSAWTITWSAGTPVRSAIAWRMW